MATFLKFFGTDSERVDLTYSIKREIARAESHKVAGFSRSKPPGVFKTGDIIFMGRMVRDNKLNPQRDYVIFGKGIVASEFSLPRDEATVDDIARINFRRKWPYYLQLTNTSFINGSLVNGIFLETIIGQFEHETFERTKQWKKEGRLNSIRQAFANQSFIEFSELASKWVEQEFCENIDSYGAIDQEFLNALPRPDNSTG